MEIQLTEEQQDIQEMARRFTAEKVTPHYQSAEQIGRLDRGLVREMAAMGLIAPDIPSEFGGIDATGVTCGVIMEAIAYGDLNLAYVPLLSSLGGNVLAKYAFAEVAKTWLPKVVSGEVLLALGLTEPGSGSDAANLRLRADKTGNSWVLNGEKASISLADQADAVVLFARTGRQEERAKGVSAFLVDLSESGVTRSSWQDVGSKSVGRGSLFFENVRVPSEYMLGDEGRGFGQVMQGFDYTRALIGLQCVGPALASLDETWEYIQQRQTFGAPLSSYQGVTFPLAEWETQVHAARLLCYDALDKRDRGERHTAEAAMCKWWAPKVAHEAIQQCLLSHGHAGYSLDLPFQQRMRDVFGLQIGDGTAQIMKMVISRERIGRAAIQPRGQAS